MDEIINYVMETPGNTNPNVLRGMLNNSGGNLPPVTSDDNGDVLTVVEGKWSKAAPSGGGGLVVNAVTVDENTTLDKTWQEILDAAKTGIVAILTTYADDDISVEYASSVYYQNSSYVVTSTTMTEYSTDSASGYPVSSGTPK